MFAVIKINIVNVLSPLWNYPSLCNNVYCPTCTCSKLFSLLLILLKFQMASLDTRMQLPCARCSLPAKVTEEPTGEEWVECTNATCSYQFCRACNCSRHPGKSCNQYDLNAPSPSKRKKCDYAVGTRKSRKNLRRLL